jgi:RimJ/RimL family protein N-acetyltransferase
MIYKILDHYKNYGYCLWKVLLKSKEKFVGITGLIYQEINDTAETEIAFRISPEHWNNGYAAEAARACKYYGETTLGKNRFISLIHPQNKASRRVAQKLGAKKTNLVLFMGQEHEVYVY